MCATSKRHVTGAIKLLSPRRCSVHIPRGPPKAHKDAVCREDCLQHFMAF